MNLQKNQQSKLLYAGFNQDYGCLACGTDTGFKILNCDPFKETFQRDFNGGGIGYVEMLFRCNILALVGGGRNPRYPPHKVMIWDDHQNHCIGELSFRAPVKAVKLRRDRVVVVLEDKVYVYNFADLKLLDQLETCPNPKGLCALCPYPPTMVLAIPAQQQGHMRVELYSKHKYTLIRAHESSLACIALNSDGTRLATASDKGTLIRIFDTETGNPLQELRRGADRAEIYSIAFNFTSEWLACSSDKGTVHVFALRNPKKDAGDRRDEGKDGDKQPQQQQQVVKQNSKSNLSFLKGILPSYFSSEWSFAHFRVPDAQSIVAFGSTENSIIVVTSSGSFYKAVFHPDKKPGGECEQVAYAQFMKPNSGGGGKQQPLPVQQQPQLPKQQ